MKDTRKSFRNFSGDLFSRRIAAPLAAIVLAGLVVLLALVVLSAKEQNRLEVESAKKLGETALTVSKRQIARNLQDYAVWEDAYEHLHVDLDFEWASTYGNVGANLFEGLGYEMAFVVNPSGNSVYSVIEGIAENADIYDFLPDTLQHSISKAAESTIPEVVLTRFGRKIFLVAATAILPPSIHASDLPADQRSTLVFVKELNDQFLDRMSNEYLLKNLELVEDRDATTASIALVGSGGQNLGHLAWTPEKPGYNLLRFQLPPLALLLLALAACTSLVVRNARKSTMALEESARKLEAFAQTVKESEARFRDVAEASSDWIWECDPQLRMTFFSSRFSDVTGIAPACVLGKTIEQFFSSEANPEGWSDFIAGTHGRHAFRDLRCAYRDSNGEPRICRLAGRPIRSADGAFVGFRGTATDITEEVLANARANHLALHDALTGLPNRVLFQEKLDFALNGPRRNAKQIAVLFLDLDHFKEVNDTLGHGAGDILLRQLAERLKSCARSNDLVARLGGDEFAVIMADVTEPSEAEALSRRIIEVTKTPFRIDAQDLFIGVSIGIAFPQEANHVPERLLKNADIALYRAKQAGRGTTCFFEAKMDIELKERKALENDLRQSILSDELELHYQPVVDIGQNRVCGVEALVRWKHSERGMVSPGTFIPLAEETGLVMAIDDWVLQEACRQATEWENLQVAVNLSSVQFRHRELVSRVQDILETTGLEPHLLELEVTEGVLINDTEAALGVLTSLKKLGVRIAMDDFGTGYSSLGYLNAFPFDKIKIDKSFISGLGESGKSNAIVKSVLRLGDSLQMVTTAEGVETPEQVAFLLAEGCQQIQGFYFAPPVPACELSEFLAADLRPRLQELVSAA